MRFYITDDCELVSREVEWQNDDGSWKVRLEIINGLWYADALGEFFDVSVASSNDERSPHIGSRNGGTVLERELDRLSDNIEELKEVLAFLREEVIPFADEAVA